MAELHSHEHVSCQEVVELVTDYLEGALPAEQAALFEQHLNFCDGCDWYVDQLRTTIATVGRIAPEEVPPEMRTRLLAAFRDRRRS
jgi:anti-sigma factor RsiW